MDAIVDGKVNNESAHKKMLQSYFNSCSPHVTFWAQALHQTHQSVIVDGSIDLWMDGFDLIW